MTAIVGRNHQGERLATGLAWLSLGLGMAAVLAPRRLSHLLGVRAHPILVRMIGLREVAAGVGILRQRAPAGWLWARVAGDVMDLGLLGGALAVAGTASGRVGTAAATVVAVTALDVLGARKMTPQDRIHTQKSITIDRPAQELYGAWHDLEKLPRFMKQIDSVRMTGPQRSHWVMRGPAGVPLEWDAETTEDRPGEMIAWRSIEGAEMDTAGTVRFEPAPGGRGTVVRVAMEYRLPGGTPTAKLVKLLGQAPEQQLQNDLHRFKQLMETGQITTTEGQSAGRSTSTSALFDQAFRD